MEEARIIFAAKTIIKGIGDEKLGPHNPEAMCYIDYGVRILLDKVTTIFLTVLQTLLLLSKAPSGCFAARSTPFIFVIIKGLGLMLQWARWFLSFCTSLPHPPPQTL